MAAQDLSIGPSTLIETRPGLDELVGRDTSHDSLVMELHRFLETPGVRDSELGDQLDTVLADQSRSARPGAGFLGTVRRIFSSRDVLVMASHHARIPFKAFWLWVPPVPSASTTFKLDMATEGKTSASFEVFGLGGGPTFDILVKEGIERSVGRSERIELTVPATIEQVEVRRNNEVESVYARLASLGAPRTWDSIRVSNGEAPSITNATATVTYDLVDDVGPTTATVSIERGTTWSASIALKVDAIGLAAGLTYNMTTSEQCSYSYELPPGFRYVAYESPEYPGYVWYVERNSGRQA